MFPAELESMLACRYSTSLDGQRPNRLIETVPLTRPVATALAGRINRGATSNGEVHTLCLSPVGFSALIARESTGRVLPTVSVESGCGDVLFRTQTAVRYLAVTDSGVRRVKSVAHGPHI